MPVAGFFFFFGVGVDFFFLINLYLEVDTIHYVLPVRTILHLQVSEW